jgi:ATP-dependent DNA helicase RecG
LQSAGIFSVEDLLNYFPRDYDDRSKVKTVAELMPEAVNTIRGVVSCAPECANLRRISITKVKIKDCTGTLELVWFNQPYLKKYFKKGAEYIFTGKVREAGQLQMISPDYEAAGEVELSGGRIVPIYTTPKLYSQKTFRALMYKALHAQKNFQENLPQKILEKYNLCNRETAVRNIHFAESDELFLKARRRLVFEELFFMQLALLNLKGEFSAQKGIIFSDTDFAPFLKCLPFTPTNAQTRVLTEISSDFSSDSRMNRLVQGDVGSGKTAIAFFSAYIAAKNGFQTALMAPTDVLASQHFESCEKILSPLGIDAVLLTGSIGAAARRDALQKISDGTAQVIIGTHALIQERVNFFRLGLCITDEQHRFGVNQRLKLALKGDLPHVLVMSATPIPRTLGLILYGDLDISIIDELPPGRQKIKTYCVNSNYRERINNFIREETAQNKQVYIICPAIEESDLKNVADYTRELSAALPGAKISHLHGRMKPDEKQQAMDEFKAGEVQILVSTTVIEVGVHVENATLIVIENAERFGLSQLHQLRGRVGRGTAQSHCVLITDSKNEHTAARMKAMTQTTDGFKLAELDLEQRGAGDFFGTRQHGLPSFKIANLYRDLDILEVAREAAYCAIKDKTLGVSPPQTFL